MVTDSLKLAGTSWQWLKMISPLAPDQDINVDTPHKYILEFGTDGVVKILVLS